MYGTKAFVMVFAFIFTGVAGLATAGLWFAKKSEDARIEAGDKPILTRYSQSEKWANVSVKRAPPAYLVVDFDPLAYAADTIDPPASRVVDVDQAATVAEQNAPSVNVVVPDELTAHLAEQSPRLRKS